MEFKTC
jgi:hypothetical protein